MTMAEFKIGDYVWEDLDCDGIQDIEESGIAGVQVQLMDANGNILDTTITDGRGRYLFRYFGDDKPTDFKVTFIKPEGYTFTEANKTVDGRDSDVVDFTTGMTDVFTVQPGRFDLTIDAGLKRIPEQEKASLGDFVFHDLDADGIQDPNEPGIAGATVKLQNAAGSVLATTTTNAQGAYSFTGLTPDTQYKVMFSQPSGFDSVSPYKVGDPTRDSNANPVNGLMSDLVTLAPGENNPTIDAGFYKSAALGDFVFNDLDQDGIQDANEPGIGGATVKLQNAAGSVLATTTTNGDGFYQFTGLRPGDYKVMFVQPNGFDNVSPFEAGNNPAIDSDANPANGLMSDVVNLTSGEFDRTVDAGFFRTPQPGIDIEKATNGQDADTPTGPVIAVGQTANFTYRVKNTGDVPLSNVTVRDDNGTPSNTGDDFSPTFTGGDSDNDGLLDLNETWTYTASRTVTAGQYTNISKVTGRAPNGQMVMDSDPSNHFGQEPPPVAKLGDVVFEDRNANGIQDSGESGISGATVKLQDANGNTLATTTTDGSGMYMFNDLTPGQYKVMFVQPNGFNAVSPYFVGNNRAIDSDANPNNGLMSNVVTLAPGEFNNTIDAGFYKFAKLGDFVFNDRDQDGFQDANEPGIAGATVKLQNAAGSVLATTTTDSSGMYMFNGLTPGQYKVMFVQPNGFDGVSPFKAGNNSAADSDANPNNGLMSDVVTLASGQFNNTIDAGFFQAIQPGINLEKLVKTTPPGSGVNGGQDLCETLGKPEVLVFQYLPSTNFNPGQPSGKAEILTNNGLDDDGTSYVIVTDEDKLQDVLAGKGDRFFAGNVDVGDTFNASRFTAGDKFSSNTYIYFFDSQGGPLLQAAQYHTSCSAPIILGAEVLSATLVGYDGENGEAFLPPDQGFVDADNAPGPEALIGTQVMFRYEVTNTGDTPLGNIQVTDDRLSGLTFEGGDANSNNLLDLNETWIYSASETAREGLRTNKGTVTGSANGIQVMDMDPANYTGVNVPPPSGDLCEVYGKPRALIFDYEIGSTIKTSQGDKAEILFQGAVDNDGTSFIIVTDEDKAADALSGKGKRYFADEVNVGDEFLASVFNANTDKFGSNTYIHFFDDRSGGLLQSVSYHTSCSQPMRLNDMVGNATLVGYQGETGGFPDPFPTSV
ncbi:hypothetical protein C7271_14850 [filamentous cyanobacterium CCP5]|nr:hypothetical protein C7271_14850 [filamentous cyanobacterium CCP5]